MCDRYREDTLWTKYRELKLLLDSEPPELPPGSVSEGPRYDDSGRFVDMSQVAENLFIGSW